jgi:flavin-dependent dehydrogenase
MGTGNIELHDGADIAVAGGGPTGSFFSIFALKLAKMIGKELNITIYDPKDFTREGPGGCNRCGGVISELLVQTLALEGINLPDSVVQRGINSYKLYTRLGEAFISAPAHENRIATVYRGGGPKGTIGSGKKSFDKFLLELAVSEGAKHEPVKIDRIEYRNKRPLLYAKDKKISEPDLLVGAVGVNSSSIKLFEGMGFGYMKPETAVMAMSEIGFDRTVISKHFNSAIHLFLIPIKGIKFAAIIPKGTYITVCIMGKDMEADVMKNFLDNIIVHNALPRGVNIKLGCNCMPRMNIKAPKTGFDDRVVMCGDAGSTRLFKDGIGAAYVMGKAAAKTAVLNGVGKGDFQRHYLPVYKDIIMDNRFGSFLFYITDFYREKGFLTRGMLEMLRSEQSSSNDYKILSSILWGLFTGNERYKNLFGSTMKLPFQFNTWKSYARGLMGRRQ